MSKKGELTTDNLVPWIIALGVIILIFVLYSVLSGKGNNAIAWIKQLWRFGG